MLRGLPKIILILSLVVAPLLVSAQGTTIDFGGLKTDTTLPVEVTADSLTVTQSDGVAVFSGNVLVTQGDMKLSAAEVRVEYGTDGTGISRLFASGGVTLKAGTDAAEAVEAVYTVATGEVVMQGHVLLTQGQAAISGEKLVVSLKDGTGKMEGRVTTTFVPGGN